MFIQEHIPLAPLTTFKIGGDARYFAAVATLEELKEALAFAKEKALPVFVLGGGSNVLISDAGFPGLVIKIDFKGVSVDGEKLTVAAGESWDAFVEYAIAQNLWGIENLSGIPGFVGGAVVGSIGAYGQAIAQTVESVEVLELVSGEVHTFSNKQCRFGYRESLFSVGEYVVLSTTFKLSSLPKPNLTYRDLAERSKGSTLGLNEIREMVLDIRKGKFPDLEKEGSAGSFFKNPIMSTNDAKKLKTHYPELPLFEMPEVSGVKVPLAWLLDHVLHMHGSAVGGARLYEKQILVIVAKENTSSRDVVALKKQVEKKVFDALEIKLESEVRIV